MIGRIATVGSLILVVVLVALLLFDSGSSYTLNADFQDAGGLVTGDLVRIGPGAVGSVKSIGLTADGQAHVVFGLNSDAAPLRQGTVARVYEDSLSGIANKYVVLEPGPGDAPPIPNGGTIDQGHTFSDVGLDQLFDTLGPRTRAGLRGFIRGEAASIQGHATQANRTLEYFAPALLSTSNVTSELARDEPAFDGLLVEGAQSFQALASRSQELTALIANTEASTGAIASQSQALKQTLSLLPGTLNHTTSTFAGLRTTLDALDPFINASKPASRRLAQFSAALRTLSIASIPTITELSDLIRNPGGTGDLTSLVLETPALAKLAQSALPRQIRLMNDSQAQVDYLREYAPDVVAALSDVGQTGAAYDSNGHYARTQPVFSAFALDSSNRLQSQPPYAREQGQEVVRGRCPGGAISPTPDGSAPWLVPGCQRGASPPGP